MICSYLYLCETKIFTFHTSLFVICISFSTFDIINEEIMTESDDDVDLINNLFRLGSHLSNIRHCGMKLLTFHTQICT